MGRRQEAVGSGQWAVDSWQFAVGSGQWWTVGSWQLAVDSRSVISGQQLINPLTN